MEMPLPIDQDVATRRTKIICTLGPATCEPVMIRALIELGTDVIRLNFSHADHAWHSKSLAAVRAIAEEKKIPVAVMQDLCGPKIRISRVAPSAAKITQGQTVSITTEAKAPELRDRGIEAELVSTYAGLLADVRAGDRLLIDDGKVELKVDSNDGQQIIAKVVRGVEIRQGKGLNMPGVPLSTPSLTEKDWNDLRWGIKSGVDFVALSFVRHPDDLRAVRKLLDEEKSPVRLIAKIERPEALEHIDEIIAIADGIMVARGDLGLETEMASVPVLQKRLIQLGRAAGKPVITATQMLESMITSAMPTRAEVSDVANAICDGSDAVMLSGETAAGAYPLEAVRVLNDVALASERADTIEMAVTPLESARPNPLTALVDGAAITARGLGAKGMVMHTFSGKSARLMSRLRLALPILAVTHDASVWRQLNLSFGVQPVYAPDIFLLPQLLAIVDDVASELGVAKSGDLLVVVSAVMPNSDQIDTMHVREVGS